MKFSEMENQSVLRILDAAFNRAAEGLRVTEDYVRFALDDRFLTQQCKELRHELTHAMSGVSLEDRLVVRESQRDVGAEIAAADEHHRQSPIHVVLASCQRTQQALRSLEEYLKTFDAPAAAHIEQLRYRAYTLQRAVHFAGGRASHLAEAQLYVLLDGRSSLAEFTSIATALVTSQVGALQLRDKNLNDRVLLERANRLREITSIGQTLCIINDRPDIARLSRADGVHVGQEELSVKDCRAIVSPQTLVGVSTHSIEQARQAVLDGADYLGVGPTFPSTTKQFAQLAGLDLIRAVSDEIHLPAFAIGGIDQENLPQVLQAGARRVALSGAILSANDPALAAQTLIEILAVRKK